MLIEYFSPKLESLKYRGMDDLLWKCDFGRVMLSSFPVRLIKVGFLWSQVYGEAGFDDMTYWLFEKLI